MPFPLLGFVPALSCGFASNLLASVILPSRFLFFLFPLSLSFPFPLHQLQPLPLCQSLQSLCLIEECLIGGANQEKPPLSRLFTFKERVKMLDPPIFWFLLGRLDLSINF
jgi:hypothetical protein